jgi:hypothetical protein
MRVRLSSLFVALVLVPTLSFADSHKADLYGGGSGGTGASSVGGVHGSIAWDLKDYPRFSVVVADFSTQFGSHQGKDLTQVSYLWGARVWLNRAGSRNKAFVQVLGGGVYYNDGTPASGAKPAIGFGGAYELGLGEPVKTSTGTDCVWGIRGEVERIKPRNRDAFTRVSGGVVFRFVRR